MKVLFLEAKKRIGKPEVKVKNLPKKLHLLYSIQYEQLAKHIKKQLENKHEILGFEQVLGCSNIEPKADLLLIGSGEFHASQLAIRTGKPIYIYENNKIRKFSQERINKHKKKIKAKLNKFYHFKNIGILFTNKPGQKSSFKQADWLENNYPNKNFYKFISNNINLNDLDNYNIDLWVNTACPGLQYDDKRILNLDVIKKEKNK